MPKSDKRIHLDNIEPLSKEDSISFKVLGLELSHLATNTQYAVCFIGLFTFSLLNGYCEELVVKRVFKKQFPLFLSLCRFSLSAICAAIERNARGEKGRHAPLHFYMVVAVFMAASMGLTNFALKYISYPVKILFKSSKPVPVMLLGALSFGKKYSGSEYLSVIIMVLGICAFGGTEVLASHNVEATLPMHNLSASSSNRGNRILLSLDSINGSSDSSNQGDELPQWHWQCIGMVCMAFALTADGMVSNVSALVFTRHRVSQSETMLFQNLGGTVLMLVACLATGELFTGLLFCLKAGTSVMFPLLLFALSNFAGSYFLLSLNKRFGAVIATLTSTARKAVQVAASFVLFPEDKILLPGHAAGGLIFILGLITFQMSQQQAKKNKLTLNKKKRELLV